MIIIIICGIVAALVITSMVLDIFEYERPARIRVDRSGYSRRQLVRITASVRHRDRRRARYGWRA